MNWPEKKSLEHSLKKIAKNKYFRIENVIKRKDDKLYVTWKEYNNSLNC